MYFSIKVFSYKISKKLWNKQIPVDRTKWLSLENEIILICKLVSLVSKDRKKINFKFRWFCYLNFLLAADLLKIVFVCLQERKQEEKKERQVKKREEERLKRMELEREEKEVRKFAISTSH